MRRKKPSFPATGFYFYTKQSTMRHLALTLIFGLAVFYINAQTSSPYPALTLRTNPVSFAENDGNVMLGLGMQFSQRIAVNIEPAYVMYNLFDPADGVRPASGLKLRTELRYYLRDFVPYGKRRFAAFVSLAGHYKNILYKRTGDFGYNFQNGVFDYYSRSRYKEHKREIGAIALFGAVFPLSASNKISGEFFFGLGGRDQQFKYSDLPPGGVFLNEPQTESEFPYFNLSGDTGKPTILIATGVKIIYRLGKKK